MSKILGVQAREYIGLVLLCLGAITFLATKDILYMVIPILLDILLLHLGNYVRYNHAWSSSQIPQITTLQINMTNLTNQVDEIKQTIKQTMNQSNERKFKFFVILKFEFLLCINDLTHKNKLLASFNKI